MTFVAAAIAATAVVGGAYISSQGAKSAANTQAASADRATEAQREMFDKQVELQAPWRQGGEQGLNALLQRLGLGGSAQFADPAAEAEVSRIALRIAQGRGESAATAADIAQARNDVSIGWSDQGASPLAYADPKYGALLAQGPEFKPFSQADFQADPGYQFRQSEQQKALERAASAQGGIGSGKFLKDAMSYSGGLASQEYGNAFSRYNANQDAAYNRFNNNRDSTFNKLASLAGIGQVATNQVGNAASQFGQQIGSNIIGAGNARAAGQVGSANAINNSISQGVSMYQQGQLMNRLYPTTYGGGGVGGGGGFGTGSTFGNQDYGQYF